MTDDLVSFFILGIYQPAMTEQHIKQIKQTTFWSKFKSWNTEYNDLKLKWNKLIT